MSQLLAGKKSGIRLLTEVSNFTIIQIGSIIFYFLVIST